MAVSCMTRQGWCITLWQATLYAQLVSGKTSQQLNIKTNQSQKRHKLKPPNLKHSDSKSVIVASRYGWHDHPTWWVGNDEIIVDISDGNPPGEVTLASSNAREIFRTSSKHHLGPTISDTSIISMDNNYTHTHKTLINPFGNAGKFTSVEDVAGRNANLVMYNLKCRTNH